MRIFFVLCFICECGGVLFEPDQSVSWLIEIILKPIEITLNSTEIILKPIGVTLKSTEFILKPIEIALNSIESTSKPFHLTVRCH